MRERERGVNWVVKKCMLVKINEELLGVNIRFWGWNYLISKKKKKKGWNYMRTWGGEVGPIKIRCVCGGNPSPGPVNAEGGVLTRLRLTYPGPALGLAPPFTIYITYFGLLNIFLKLPNFSCLLTRQVNGRIVLTYYVSNLYEICIYW